MSGFTFKQFHINQQDCAMKVGTDGILLGAWADFTNCRRILDMGCGTGLLALMLAQRSAPDCQIYAVELDLAAAQQAQQNINDSPWRHRIELHQGDVLHFLAETASPFDLIVANPPYFAQGVHCKNAQRQLARYMQQCHSDWLNRAAQRLSPNGEISFVVPFEAVKSLMDSAELHCVKQTAVITKIGKTPRRMLITFAKQSRALMQDGLVIYDEHHQYTAEFVALTKDFYLKF